jgi:hypothetical protein
MRVTTDNVIAKQEASGARRGQAGRSLQLFRDLPASSAERAIDLVVSSPVVEIEIGKPYARSAFPAATALIVESGFVIVRAVIAQASRPVITCDAGPGGLVLPPGEDGVLCALEPACIRVISPARFRRLLEIPLVAERLLEEMVLVLGRKQDAIAVFGPTRHRERVRRKLLQLGCSYGHIGRDGVRIDFPISHALLAEMIGSSRETVTRAVDELARSGFVTRRGSTYHLAVPPELV